MREALAHAWAQVEQGLMGEVSHDMVSGGCCSRCSLYFEGEHGYPVLCLKCWRAALWTGGRAGYSVAIIQPIDQNDFDRDGEEDDE